jgi:hypothetical protein
MALQVTENSFSPRGPFPSARLAHTMERRWLHFAFVNRGGTRAVIANLAWLGGEAGLPGLHTAILLVYDHEMGWSSSQWNASGPTEPWSSFRRRCGPPGEEASTHFALAASKGLPAVSLRLRSTSTPGVSGCATFGADHWQRWQAEPGVLASGVLTTAGGDPRPFDAVGYHERVRGRWGWPEMGGWVFGFCNDVAGDGTPAWSLVFALLQPEGGSPAQTCVLMLWRRGRLVRFIPRRTLRVSVAGQLDRDWVETRPSQAALLGTPPTVPIPAALSIDGYQGRDWVQLRFRSRVAARLVVPCETSARPFSVHEVLGETEVQLAINGRRAAFRSPAIVEFAGGAAEGSPVV